MRQTIANGRQGQMPAHLERLGEVRTKLVAAYVLSAAAPSTDAPGAATLSAATPGTGPLSAGAH